MKAISFKNILIYAVIVLAIVATSVGGTYAYLTDKQDTDNVLAFGEAKIVLQDSNKDAGGNSLAPGNTKTRTPTVANVGTVPTFVRVMLVISDAGLDNQQTITDFTALDKNTTDWDWSSYDTDQTIYYKAVLKQGEVAPPIINGITLNSKDSGGNVLLEGANNNFKMFVSASAVQSDLDGKNYTDSDARRAFADMMP